MQSALNPTGLLVGASDAKLRWWTVGPMMSFAMDNDVALLDTVITNNPAV